MDFNYRFSAAPPQYTHYCRRNRAELLQRVFFPGHKILLQARPPRQIHHLSPCPARPGRSINESENGGKLKIRWKKLPNKDTGLKLCVCASRVGWWENGILEAAARRPTSFYTYYSSKADFPVGEIWDHNLIATRKKSRELTLRAVVIGFLCRRFSVFFFLAFLSWFFTLSRWKWKLSFIWINQSSQLLSTDRNW